MSDVAPERLINRIELGFTPYQHQRDAHETRLAKRFVVLVWHRRAGKTVFAVMELILAALRCTRERGRYGYVTPWLKQAKAVAWDYLKVLTSNIPGVSYNESELAVDLPNGARIRLFGADNPVSLRGLYFDGVILDEVADMRPQVWGEIIRPTLADRQGWAIFIGTPKGVNLFSEVYFSALKGTEGWAADLRRASDTGVIPAEELEQARQSMSPNQYAQEFDCDFAAAVVNALITLDLVLAAESRSLGEAEYNFSPKVLGVDVARYGDDRSALCPRQGLAAFPPKTFRKLDTMQLAGQVAMSIEAWDPDAVFIDLGAMGAGVVDRLRQLQFDVIGIDFGGKATDPRFENKRAEMWWLMGDWLKAGAAIPRMTELAGELTAPTFTYANARGKLQLESKDDMRARGLPSPDIADGYALTFAMPVVKRPPKEIRGTARAGAALCEYDPYG